MQLISNPSRKSLTFNSNKYWGWGGEDDDMYQRIKWANYKISRPQPKLARFKMIKHLNEKKNAPNMNRFNLLKHVLDRMPTDGINRFVIFFVKILQLIF